MTKIKLWASLCYQRNCQNYAHMVQCTLSTVDFTHHHSAKLSSIVKFTSNVFCNLLSCLCEGIFSGHHIVHGVLDVHALAFKLCFLIGIASVVIASSLIWSRSRATDLASVHSRGGSHFLDCLTSDLDGKKVFLSANEAIMLLLTPVCQSDNTMVDRRKQ